jgi:Uma2 family endonuclease
MAIGALVSVEEYLNTSYRPDCDYVDGEVRERNLGELEHCSAQREIMFYLGDHYPQLRKRLLPEQRVQVNPSRFRVADVCVLAEDAPREKIVRTPPMLCIEILSPEDTMNKLMERVKDYFNMGVPACWIVDPIAREAWIATRGQLIEATDGVLRAGGIEMPLNEVLE